VTLRVQAGRLLLLALIPAAGLAAIRIAPRWLTPEPSLASFLTRIHERDFAGANDLVPALRVTRRGDVLAELLYEFPRGAKPGAALDAMRGQAVAFFPRGRVYDLQLAFRWHDFREEAAGATYRVDLRCEATPARSFGPFPAGTTLVPQAPGADLGPPGAACEWRLLSGDRTLDRAIFEILPPEPRRAISTRLAAAHVLASDDYVAERWLQAMAYASARCYGDSLAALEAVLSTAPADPFLNVAREHLAAELRASL